MDSIAHEPAADALAGELLGLADELERKLELLDMAGAHIAAAHLDSAIARIRADRLTG